MILSAVEHASQLQLHVASLESIYSAVAIVEDIVLPGGAVAATEFDCNPNESLSDPRTL